MGARDVIKPVAELVLFVLVLHLFLGSSSFVNGANNYTFLYSDKEKNNLQTILAAWNNTPDMDSNLAGWGRTQLRYCEYLDPNSIPTKTPSWRGLQCTYTCNNSKAIDPNCTVRRAWLVGISIANASIEGVLPPSIGNFSWLATLELTGNPNLTGTLPKTLQNLWLNVLDVHDNGFIGNIPDLGLLWNLLVLDLSGNKFTGEYPFVQLSSMDYLQTLSVGDNDLSGSLQANAFENKTELDTLDISDNKFNETVPNLTIMPKLRHLDVSGNQFEGRLPDLSGFKALRHVNLGRNRFTGTANLQDILNLSGTPALAFVDLSHNNLTGDLPSWNQSSLGSIQGLYLDNNTLTGTLDIPQMFDLGLLKNKSEAANSTEKLKIMSLSNNNIQNVVFNANVIENVATVFILDGNPYCNDYDDNDDGQRCYCTQLCYISPVNANSRRIITISVIISVFAVALILLAVVGALLYKNKRYKRYLQIKFEQRFEEFDVKPTIFSYSELKAATRDFSEDMKLGQGGYGTVYKGVLPNGTVVAVKQLYVKAATGMDEFLNEVILITGMKHRNLVTLKGCCLRESQRLLVYEYVDNYDVDQIVLGPKREELTWPIRLKICLGIARGLHYLHALALPRVIHRDIKASNVLLDGNMEPKIADFGLALLFPDNQSHIMTVHVAGTKGYLAPEYASFGQLSDKVDVFSFGVLCLEIISGRKNIEETAPLDQIYLSQWAWVLHEEDRLMELIDPQLQLTTDEEVRDVQRVINLCLLCIQNSAEKRPSMARIVSILQSDTESELIVLGEGKQLSSTWSLCSTWSNKSADFTTGLGSVSEEGSSSNGIQGAFGTPTGSSHGKYRRRADSGPECVKVELTDIRAR